MSSKKGSTEVLILVIVLLVIAIAIPIIYYAFDLVATDMSTEFTRDNETASNDIIVENRDAYPSVWDAGIIFFFFGCWFAALITSFFLDSNPIFFIISIFFLICSMSAIIIIREFWIELTNMSTFSFFETTFPLTYWLMSNIYTTSIIVTCSVLIALYAKWSSQ